MQIEHELTEKQSNVSHLPDRQSYENKTKEAQHNTFPIKQLKWKENQVRRMQMKYELVKISLGASWQSE